jgi:putative membrane protein
MVATSLGVTTTPAVSVRSLVLGWRLSPAVIVAVLAAAVWYVAARRRLRGARRCSTRGRATAFLAGLAVIVVALDSGLAAYDDSVFALHVVQHLLLGMVAPILLALGAPVTLAIQASRRPLQSRILGVVHSRPVAVLTHPLVTWVLFGGTMIGLYFTPLYDLSVRNPVLHDVVHVHFLVAGMLFFWPVVGLDPTRWRLPHGARLLYVFLAIPFHAIVGVTLLTGSTPLYAAHTLADQQAGAAIMWGAGDFVALAAVAIVLSQWIAYDKRDAAREDRRLDALDALRSVDPFIASPAAPRTALRPALGTPRFPGWHIRLDRSP